MKVAETMPLLSAVIFLFAAQANADDFPASYIRAQLQSANKSIEINLEHLKPEQTLIVEYVDRPIWVYHRTDADLAYLKKRKTDSLADPSGANTNESILAAYSSSASEAWARLLLVSEPEISKARYRSLKDRYLVVAAWGPQSGCFLRFEPRQRQRVEHAAIHDSCVDAFYDVAGRALKGELQGRAAGQQARYNLHIPPHRFVSDSKLIVGVSPSQNLPTIRPSLVRSGSSRDANERLMVAALYDDYEAARTAIRDGAKTNFYVEGKGSPLDAAIIGSSMKIIELLIANGARPTPNSRNAAAFVKRQDVIDLIDRIESK